MSRTVITMIDRDRYRALQLDRHHRYLQPLDGPGARLGVGQGPYELGCPSDS